MFTLIDAALGRSRTVLSALILILLAGSASYVAIPKESDPDISLPIINVKITHDGISPQDAERLLIRPMELELRTIEGIKEMRAVGYEGGADVTLEFEAGFDVDQALLDVREQVDEAKSELPEESDEPLVREFNISLFPIIAVALSGNIPERTLLKLARDLKDEIEGISTVLKVDVAGDRDELVEVLIDPVKLESYGISPLEALEAVSRSNLLIAAGSQDTGQGRFAIKVPGLFENIHDINNMPVTISGDAVVTLGDVSEVRRGFKDAEGFARINGRPALVLEVTKRTGENIIETIEAVYAVVARERASWPPGLTELVQVDFMQDKSKDIRTMLTDLQNNVISAVVLVMIVVVFALGLRTALLVGIAIPGSFLMAILVLYSFGATVNVVVLFSLILAVGMLVDGAIVVTEYADRKMLEGEHRSVAYGLAAKRMSWPIIASTATTLAAFLPLLFWPDVVGEFMKFLPMTLSITLLASLLMALIFVPTLGSLVGAPGVGGADVAQGLSAAQADKDDLSQISGFTGGYLKVLRAALKAPVMVMVIAVGMLIGIPLVYSTVGKGVEFFPNAEPELAKLEIRARGNLSTLEKDKLVRDVESRVIHMPELKSVYGRTGKSTGGGTAEDTIGTITLEFVDWDKRRKAFEILGEISDATKDLVGIVIDQRQQEQGPPGGKAVQIEVSSRFPELLEGAVAHLARGVREVGGFYSVEDSRPLPGIEWVLEVDRAQAAKFGVDVDNVGRSVQMITTGIKLDEYRPDDVDEEIDIRARYPEDKRTIHQLDNIRISTAQGQIPIGNFMKRSARPRVGTIIRSDSRRVMTIKAEVDEGLLPDQKIREMRDWLERNPLPGNVDIKFKGEDEDQKKSQDFLIKAFMVALFVMAIILVTQFNSFYSALLILSAVIMSTIGVFIGLMVMGQPFGIVMSGIGVIALAGIVVNNNIVLIDTYDRLIKTEKDAYAAILRTGAQRLRPVLLTTVTTVLGLMPMVLGVNIDFFTREVTIGAPSTRWWQQLSTAIVFGLVFATVLTLIVTPSALMLKTKVAHWAARVRARLSGKPRTTG